MFRKGSLIKTSPKFLNPTSEVKGHGCHVIILCFPRAWSLAMSWLGCWLNPAGLELLVSQHLFSNLLKKNTASGAWKPPLQSALLCTMPGCPPRHGTNSLLFTWGGRHSKTNSLLEYVAKITGRLLYCLAKGACGKLSFWPCAKTYCLPSPTAENIYPHLVDTHWMAIWAFCLVVDLDEQSPIALIWLGKQYKNFQLLLCLVKSAGLLSGFYPSCKSPSLLYLHLSSVTHPLFNFKSVQCLIILLFLCSTFRFWESNSTGQACNHCSVRLFIFLHKTADTAINPQECYKNEHRSRERSGRWRRRKNLNN